MVIVHSFAGMAVVKDGSIYLRPPYIPDPQDIELIWDHSLQASCFKGHGVHLLMLSVLHCEAMGARGSNGTGIRQEACYT